MSERFITPEAVVLRHEHAGLGSRFVTLFLDGLIQMIVFIALVLAAGAVDLGIAPGIAPAVAIAAVVFLHLAYFVVFEVLWDGRTPGKRVMKLRVVRIDGQPLGWTGSLVRNVLRLVDSLFFYAVGAVVMILSSDDQRLGDLAAGTIVIHEPSRAVLDPAPEAVAAGWIDRIDVGGVSEREYALARSFLQRRDALAPDARLRIADEIAATLRHRVVGVPDGADAEEVVETIVAAVRG